MENANAAGGALTGTEGEGAGPANETKDAKFKRLVGDRAPMILDRIAHFEKLFAPKHYTYTAEQVAKYCDQFIARIEKMRANAIEALTPKTKGKEEEKFEV